LLATHEEISTTPEPWVLLPYVYAAREGGSLAEYGEVAPSRAIRQFIRGLSDGEEGYRDELRRFVLGLYWRASEGRGRYFLDKTPRYHFIVEDLFRLFPDGKFVFLWRNPLAIVASIVETWGGGRWKVERWHRDLFDGAVRLLDAYERHSDASHAIRYEDLVTDPDSTLRSVFDYLDLSFEPSRLASLASVKLSGRMGDRTGSVRYGAISTDPLDAWRATVMNPVRKRWLRGYLRWIGDRRLSTMGYDLAELTRELDAVPFGFRRVGSDLARGTYWRLASIGREAAFRSLSRRPAARTGAVDEAERAGD
jgi:hypothetical protein